MADDLDPNAADRWASVIRQAGALAPAAGPVAAELLTQVIPRQRMDRVVEYIRRIDIRLQTIEAERAVARQTFERNARSEYGTAIIEDSVIQSARTVEPESRERIAAVVVRSLTEEDLKYERTRKLLGLLGELLHAEIITLLYYFHSADNVEASSGYYERHRPTLEAVSASLDSDEETRTRAAIRESYRSTLARLGLLNAEQRQKPKRCAYHISSLGRVLVRYIEMDVDMV